VVKRRASLLLVVAVLAFGCDKRSAPGSASSSSDNQGELKFALTGLDTKIERRLDGLWTTAGLDKAMDAFVEGVIAEPSLAEGGSKLFEALGSDPKLSAELEKVMNGLVQSPRVQQLIAAMMAAHPGEDIGKLAGDKVGQAWELPAISKGFEDAFQQLLGKVDVKGELGAISRGIEARVAGIFNDGARTAKWTKRITELNGGTRPSPDQATQLYLDHAWSEARMQKFLTTILSNKTLQVETARFLADLIALPPIDAELRRSVGEIAADPQLQQAASELMIQLLDEHPDVATVTAAQRQLLTSPLTVKAAQRLAHIVLADPKVAELAGMHLGKIAADPVLRAAFDDLIDHW